MTIQEEAEKYANLININFFGMKLPEKNKDTIKDFIAGATSESAKEYWYKQFEAEKLKFAIDKLKELRLPMLNDWDAYMIKLTDKKIKNLEKQLKELNKL